MTEAEAIRIVDEGLVGPEGVPAKLAMRKGLDKEQLEEVKEALRFLVEAWAGRADVPKKIAMAFVDLGPGMMRAWDFYPEAEQEEIEEASMALVDLGLSLFAEPENENEEGG